jgi:hypothetical protein
MRFISKFDDAISIDKPHEKTTHSSGRNPQSEKALRPHDGEGAWLENSTTIQTVMTAAGPSIHLAPSQLDVSHE